MRKYALIPYSEYKKGLAEKLPATEHKQEEKEEDIRVEARKEPPGTRDRQQSEERELPRLNTQDSEDISAIESPESRGASNQEKDVAVEPVGKGPFKKSQVEKKKKKTNATATRSSLRNKQVRGAKATGDTPDSRDDADRPPTKYRKSWMPS